MGRGRCANLAGANGHVGWTILRMLMCIQGQEQGDYTFMCGQPASQIRQSTMGGGRCANLTGANRHFRWNFLETLMCDRPGTRRLCFIMWAMNVHLIVDCLICGANRSTDQTVNNGVGHSMIQMVPLTRCAIRVEKQQQKTRENI